MYRPCYAPVFSPSSGIDCILLRIRMAILIALLLIILAITFGSEGILCMIRRASYRMQHCGEGNSDPNIDIGFTLDRWIRETPHVRNAIIWRPDGNTALSYAEWSRSDKELLHRLYDELKDSGTAAVAERPEIAGFRSSTSESDDRRNTLHEAGYTLEIARHTFFAHFMGNHAFAPRSTD